VTIPVLSAATALAAILAAPVAADTIRAATTFNTADQKMVEPQPAAGMEVTYPIRYTGGLDGCAAEVAETLYPQDEGAWGIYEVAADVTCGDGGFAFTSTGSWNDKGFHGAGRVTEGSGTGSYAGLAGRIAQNGGMTAAAGDTFDIGYEILIAPTEP